MAASFYVVPQWQGSASARAMRVAEGAIAISRDLPSSSTTLVEIPGETGDEQGSGVQRCSSVATVRDRLAQALAEGTTPAITIGGDCGVELAAVAHAVAPDTAVLWFDAHPDLNTPESSPSGAFTGMVLRTLLGEGAPQLVPEHPIDPAMVVLVGARDLDDSEADYVAAAGIRMLAADTTPDALLETLAQMGARSVYVHIDLDVLDPGTISGIGNPVPFGMTGDRLVELVRAAVSARDLRGAGITEFAPASLHEADDDLAAILRIIGALTR